MPMLELFSRRQIVTAYFGFLLGLTALPLVLAGTVALIWRSPSNGEGTAIASAILVLFAIASLICGIAALFWTLSRLSALGVWNYRMANTCAWIWIGGMGLKVAAGLLQREMNPTDLILALLVFVLRPKPGARPWSWPSHDFLESREGSPFLWGMVAALGLQAMALSLGMMEPRAQDGLVQGIFGAISTGLQGILLGLLMKTWTKRRWPANLTAGLVVLALAAICLLRSRFHGWAHFTPWTSLGWPLGLVAGDQWALREDGQSLTVPA